MAEICDRPAVILTGFGPFKDHKTNDSWAAVCQITQGDRGKSIEESLGVRLVTEHMPVSYDFADRAIPDLWEAHKPLFVLHVGIHVDDLFRIETKSFRSNYTSKDINGKTPEQNICRVGTEEILETKLDTVKLLEDVKATLGSKGTNVEVALSENPGNFLCGYSFYTSLCADAERCLFLHIPPPSSSIPIEHKADVVEAVMIRSVEQLRATCGNREAPRS
ncbi:Pyroglutamyl-peptidase [Nesidiocoris tenuis]|uniref:Pyroglutamyl-peptidase n=1 Tax=Nesidiocoris tenuis TaxID=355587 RepID=A0ABN7BEU6_9HEMI|nr:Pyroglutamyl-peptidase [Nesidiocoris tenuis]